MIHETAEQKIANLKTGTTTVGLITATGVVLGADMRASMGNIAYDEESEKIYKITDNIAVTNAGNVGDSLTIIRYLKSQARLYEIERDEKMPLKAASTLLSNILNGNRYYPYIVQLIIGGLNNKPEIFEVGPFGGAIERRQYAVTGSGTDYALTTLDHFYKDGMNEDEGIKLAIKAVAAGKRRDIYSGGISVTIAVIDKNGVRMLSQEEILAHKEEMDKQKTSSAPKKK